MLTYPNEKVCIPGKWLKYALDLLSRMTSLTVCRNTFLLLIKSTELLTLNQKASQRERERDYGLGMRPAGEWRARPPQTPLVPARSEARRQVTSRGGDDVGRSAATISGPVDATAALLHAGGRPTHSRPAGARHDS
jgi:hypothetical protein